MAITPAAGYVSVPSSIFIGTVAALISNLVAHWRAKTSLEDTLDVFPCHGVGGLVGMVLTACLANVAINSANTTGNGLFFGEFHLFKIHMIGLAIVVAYIFIGSFIILKITDLISPLRVSSEDKMVGNDFSQHGENLYPIDYDKRVSLNSYEL